MKLQTQIPFKKQEGNLIDYDSKILLLGSCFVENIGDKLEYFKFQNLQNPFGILFNPVAIERLICNTIEGRVYSEKDVFFHNEGWHCYDAHSKLSSTSREALLQNLNDGIVKTKQQIIESTHIIITLGTAWVYKHLESDKIVANCHKVPQNEFNKEILSIKEIVISLEEIVNKMAEVNPKATIIFTVSPVRHLKDGFIENQQSKAHLISAIHQLFLLRAFRVIRERSLSYFPSYEIMMDELRDYRFYMQDMIHPNPTAIDFIWEKFKHVWVSENTFLTMDEVESIQKGLSHKPFNVNSEEHQNFLERLILRKKKLQVKFPQIVFD